MLLNEDEFNLHHLSWLIPYNVYMTVVSIPAVNSGLQKVQRKSTINVFNNNE